MWIENLQNLFTNTAIFKVVRKFENFKKKHFIKLFEIMDRC